MPRPAFRPSAVPLLLLAAALGVAGACSDRANPTAARPDGPGRGTPGAPVTVQALQCSGNRASLSLSCLPLKPAAGGGASDIIVGNQNVYVKVTTSNIAYNSGTGQFTFDATLQNLIEQPLGTTDGTTLDPNGVRVFFHSGPTLTSGTGTVAVLPDGFATFTAVGQPYYQYNQVLANTVTSAAKTWTLIMPPTVGTFSFLLYVSAPVEYPSGYITLDGTLPGASYGVLHPGSTHALTAVAKNNVGTPTGASVSFSSTDPNCLTVDGAGLVTGVRYATCSVTATAGPIGGSMVFNVSGAVRTWTGAVSTDWSVGGNWNNGLVPATADSVTIPTGVPNFPVLTTAVTVSDVTVADLATLDLAGFVLTSTGNVGTGATAPSGILASGAGSLLLSGSSKLLHGRFPTTLVTGSYALDGLYHGVAPQTVDNGSLASDLFELQVEAQ